AEPEDHYRRVEAQGDRRPMRNRPDAMQELKRLLDSRARLYAQAQHVVATSGRSEAAVVEDVLSRLT
ncbi:MAG TPA: shikimate kinase, partial [Planctomycetota bacterium]|nr:shikimate kinase [Planctomycetota bacterium]